MEALQYHFVSSETTIKSLIYFAAFYYILSSCVLVLLFHGHFTGQLICHLDLLYKYYLDFVIYEQYKLDVLLMSLNLHSLVKEAF